MTGRPRRRTRVLRAAAGVLAVIGCALGPTGCGPAARTGTPSTSGTPDGASTPTAVAVEPGPADLVTSTRALEGGGWTVGFSPDARSEDKNGVATAPGPVAIRRVRSGEDPEPTDQTVLAALDPQDGSLRWSATITPAIEPPQNTLGVSTSQEAVTENARLIGAPGPVVVSPNGRYIALQLQSNDPTAIADTRAAVLVLDAATGETVRTLQTAGLVLGRVLTDSELVVQTAQDYVPAGSTLTVAPLGEPDAEPSTLRTDQWLMGSTAHSLLLSPDGLSGLCSDSCASTTITKMTVDGESLATIPAVYRVLEGGRVERYTDPAAANDAVASGQWAEWVKTGREILDIEAGTTTDITGYATGPEPLLLADGTGVLLNRLVPLDPEKPGSSYSENHPAAWVGAPADGGAVHTEPVTAVASLPGSSADLTGLTFGPLPMTDP